MQVRGTFSLVREKKRGGRRACLPNLYTAAATQIVGRAVEVGSARSTTQRGLLFVLNRVPLGLSWESRAEVVSSHRKVSTLKSLLVRKTVLRTVRSICAEAFESLCSMIPILLNHRAGQPALLAVGHAMTISPQGRCAACQ